MDQTQRDILISKRVELVENLDMTGGLYTHLLARKILNQRKVNEFKLQRTPEGQAEELLSYLPKRDCFNSFCEALIADGQDDIVEKYLKISPMKQDSQQAPQKLNSNIQDVPSPTTQQQVTACVEPAERETPDCVLLPKTSRQIHQQHSSPTPPAILCIKESDDRHVYIKYNNPPSPIKRQKLLIDDSVAGIISPYSGEDTTRYALKHYVSNEDEVVDSGVSVHHNTANSHPRTLTLDDMSGSKNMSGPSSGYSTFAWQHAEKPYEDNFKPSDPSTKSTIPGPLQAKKITHNDNIPLPVHDLGNHERVSPQNTGNLISSSFPKIGQEISGSSPSKKYHCFPADSFQSNHTQFSGPRKYLEEAGVLPCLKRVASIENHNLAYESTAAYKGDSLDAMSSFPNHYGAFQTNGNVQDCIRINVEASEASKEPEIDLPDGCANVKVEHSTRQFFLSNFKKSYPMRQIPRGLALVINVDEVEGKPPRKGTNFDRDNLCNLLTQLHFNIMVYNDKDGLSAQEMVNKLKAFAKLNEHHNYDACFICLLSHGEEGYIFGTDGKRIPLEEIFMLFGNTNCKGLIGKPKVFIIQACRGGTLDKGVRMGDEPDGGSLPAKAPISQQLPSMSDMLICYPTLMGYYAWRNRARGSWYIEAIVQVFMRYAKNEDICAMLNRVNQVVSRKVSECNQKEMNQMSQMSEYKSTLRQPHLFLFPGIGCSALPH